MEITSNKTEMIFRKDFEGKPIYSIGLSKKRQDGTYDKGYMTVNFKKGTDLGNQTRIKIKEAWLDFYTKDKKTIPTIFINKYELVGIQEPSETNPFEEFGNSIKTESNFENIEITDDDLPF